MRDAVVSEITGGGATTSHVSTLPPTRRSPLGLCSPPTLQRSRPSPPTTHPSNSRSVGDTQIGHSAYVAGCLGQSGAQRSAAKYLCTQAEREGLVTRRPVPQSRNHEAGTVSGGAVGAGRYVCFDPLSERQLGQHSPVGDEPEALVVAVEFVAGVVRAYAEGMWRRRTRSVVLVAEAVATPPTLQIVKSALRCRISRPMRDDGRTTPHF
jgi:hypothetical protein